MDLAAKVCGAVWRLAWRDTHHVKLRAAGACEAVVHALQTWGTADNNVAEQG